MVLHSVLKLPLISEVVYQRLSKLLRDFKTLNIHHDLKISFNLLPFNLI